MSEPDDESRDPFAAPSGESGHEPSGAAGDVGSVGEEAAKLFGALAGWAREQSPDDLGADPASEPDASAAPGEHDGTGFGADDLRASLGGLAGRAARTWHEIDEHVATGAPECAYCPLCRTVHVVRAASPEVRAHLTTAATSLLQAGLQLLGSLPAGDADGPRPDRSASADPSRRSRDVHRIDLDGQPDSQPESQPESQHDEGRPHDAPDEPGPPST